MIKLVHDIPHTEFKVSLFCGEHMRELRGCRDGEGNVLIKLEGTIEKPEVEIIVHSDRDYKYKGRVDHEGVLHT